MELRLVPNGIGEIRSSSSPATPNSFSRPRPRPQRTPSQAARVRVRNRRREYLNRNPSYFNSAEQEFADSDLYDKLIRKFQSPAEREAEVRSKGWGKTLESSLMRGEARLGKLKSSDPDDATSPAANGGARNIDSTVAELLVDDKPATKEEGRASWDEYLRERFVRGGDEDFDYVRVDDDDDLDLLEHLDQEEAYFDDEEPEWADDSDIDETTTDSAEEHGHKTEKPRRPKRERILLGQTGIQDF